MKNELTELKINFFPRVGFVSKKSIEDKEGKKRELTKEEKASNSKAIPISAFITIGKQPRIRIPGVAKIAPEDWDPISQRARIANNAVHIKKTITGKINEDIEYAYNTITDIYNNFIDKHGYYPTDLEAFKEVCVNAIKGISDTAEIVDPLSKSFFRYIEDYIKDAKSGKRMIKSSTDERKYSERSIKGYTTTLNTIKDFRKTTGNKDLEFEEVTLKFYTQFESFVKEKEFSKNYFGSFIKYIKKFMKESREEGFHNNVDFLKKDFLKVAVESESVALSVPQLQSLASFDFSDNPCYDNTRDFFLVGAWTGLRYSDFSRLTKDFIDGDFIDIKTQKTGKIVVVPILPELRKVLDKYQDTETGFPRAISDVKLNEYIKEICKIVGEKSSDKSFIEESTTTFNRTDRKVKITEPFYKKISSHTGRRSFATNAVRLKIPTESIKQITGHKTDAAFFKYVKIEPREHAIAMMEAVMRGAEVELVS